MPYFECKEEVEELKMEESGKPLHISSLSFSKKGSSKPKSTFHQPKPIFHQPKP
jgi:hypothetical protein